MSQQKQTNKDMTTFTAKQIKAITKAEMLIKQANDLLQNSIGHLSGDIIVEQKLARVRNAAQTTSLILEN